MFSELPRRKNELDAEQKKLSERREVETDLFQHQANIRNARRSFSEKLLHQNKLTAKDLAHEQANFFNNRYTQITEEQGASQAIGFAERTKKLLTKDDVARGESVISHNPVLGEAFRTGDFIPYFKDEIGPQISNPVSLRMFAIRFCNAGMTPVTVDHFYEQPDIQDFVHEKIVSLLSTLSSPEEIWAQINLYIENKIFTQEVGVGLYHEITGEVSPHIIPGKESTEATELFKKATSRHGHTKIVLSEAIPDAERKTYLGHEVPENLKGEMLRAYQNNYSDERGYSSEFRELLQHGMQEAFTNPSGRFHVLYYKDEVLGFMYIKELSRNDNETHKRKYLGMFNVIPDVAGTKIGTLFLKEVLREEGADCTIEALADPTTSICEHYIEKNGFVGTNEEIHANRKLLKIILSPDYREIYTTKEKGYVNYPTQHTVLSIPLKDILSGIQEDRIAVTTSKDGQESDLSPLQNGFVLTRVLMGNTQSNQKIFVFEKEITPIP